MHVYKGDDASDNRTGVELTFGVAPMCGEHRACLHRSSLSLSLSLSLSRSLSLSLCVRLSSLQRPCFLTRYLILLLASSRTLLCTRIGQFDPD